MRLEQLTERGDQILGIYRGDWKTVEELEAHLKKIGAVKVGAGHFSTVYKHPSHKTAVVKISGKGDQVDHESGDLAWRKWAEFCYLNRRSNEHLLRVLEAKPIGNFYFAAMEVLTFDNRKVMEVFKPFVVRTTDRGRTGVPQELLEALIYEAAGIKRPPKMWTGVNGGMLVVPSVQSKPVWDAWESKNKKLAEALIAAAKLTDGVNKLDLQMSNFGFRGNTIVLVDPLYNLGQA